MPKVNNNIFLVAKLHIHMFSVPPPQLNFERWDFLFLSKEPTPVDENEAWWEFWLELSATKAIIAGFFLTNGSNWRHNLYFSESQLCSHPQQSSDTIAKCSNPAVWPQQVLKEVNAFIIGAMPFYCLETMHNGKRYFPFVFL